MSTPSIHPANWKTVSASTAREWYIHYRFYDASTPQGRQKIVKGMNEYRDPVARRQATQRVLDDLLGLLKRGWNPVTEKYTELVTPGEIAEHTPMIQALGWALNKCGVVPHYKADMRSMLKYVTMAAELLDLANMPVYSVRKKHIKRILEKCFDVNPTFTANRYNKYRTHLMILFGEISEVEAIDMNPVNKDLKIKKTTRKERTVLTETECNRADAALRWFNYPFWRFMHIFFHSGSRETEILQVKGKDVFLERQFFYRTIKKGRTFWVKRTTIKNIALPLWIEAMEGCGPEDYVFSRGLAPGPKSIRRDQIDKRWRRWAKKLLGIEADFYSLKHLNSTQTTEIAGEIVAANQNGHTDPAMLKKVYDVRRESREHEAMKSVCNPLAG